MRNILLSNDNYDLFNKRLVEGTINKSINSRIRGKINLLLCSLIEKEMAFKEKIFLDLKLKEYLLVNILQEDQKTYSIDFMNLLRKFFDY